MSIASKLQKVLEIKNNIKQALINKGVDVSGGFEKFAEQIENIQGGGGVPSGFTELEYIQNTTNGNYINLFYYATQDTKLVTTIEHSGSYATTTASFVMGSIDGTNTFRMSCSSTNASPARYFSTSVANNAVSLGSALTANKKYNIELSMKSGFICDGVLIGTFPQSTFKSTQPFYLFNSSNSTNHCFLGKIYATQIYEGDTLLYDLVPVKQRYNSSFGFYNKVDGCLYLPTSQAMTGK